MACNCNVGLSNTGTPTCQPIMSVTRKLIIVPLTADDGTKNQIDVTATLDQTFIDGLINNADASKRWFPTGLIDNVEDTKGDDVTEALNSGSNIFIQEGPRTFTGVEINQGSVYLGKLLSARCVKFGVYVIDKDSSLIGSISSDGAFLNPIAVDQNTWSPKLIKTTDTTVQKIQIDFEFSRVEKDENLRQIQLSEFSGTDPLDMSGLIDVNNVVSSITTTSFTVTQTMDYGTAVTKLPVEGFLLADYTLTEVSPVPGAVVITSVTESADGVYDFVIPIQITGDELELTAAKNGFDFPTTTIIIP